MKEKIKESVRFLNELGIKKAELGIVLGTGLDGLIEDIEIIEIPVSDEPAFTLETIETISILLCLESMELTIFACSKARGLFLVAILIIFFIFIIFCLYLYYTY